MGNGSMVGFAGDFLAIALPLLLASDTAGVCIGWRTRLFRFKAHCILEVVGSGCTEVVVRVVAAW